MMVDSHLQAPLASQEHFFVCACVYVCLHSYWTQNETRCPCQRYNHDHIPVESCRVFLICVGECICQELVSIWSILRETVCLCVDAHKARVALREELQQRGRRVTPHWQARRANHRQQIRPLGCRPIPQYPWWVREWEKERNGKENKRKKAQGERDRTEEHKKRVNANTRMGTDCVERHEKAQGAAQTDKSQRSVGKTFKGKASFSSEKVINKCD